MGTVPLGSYPGPGRHHGFLLYRHDNSLATPSALLYTFLFLYHSNSTPPPKKKSPLITNPLTLQHHIGSTFRSFDDGGAFFLLVASGASWVQLYDCQSSILTQRDLVHKHALSFQFVWHFDSLGFKTVSKFSMTKSTSLAASSPGEQLAFVY